MANNQQSIDAVCTYRQLPAIKKGMSCIVDGQPGRIWGGNHNANFNVKFDVDGKINNCHPGWRMTILDYDGTVIHQSEE